MKIFVLMGKSASGKDSIYKKLLGFKSLSKSIEPLVLYTTRPMRDGEINGVTYNFVSDKEFEEMWEGNPRLLEARTYQVVNYKWWQYGTVLPEDMNGNYLTINTPSGIGTMLCSIDLLKEKDPSISVEVYPILIESPGHIRIKRSLQRLENPSDKDVAEICRRYMADEFDFKTIDEDVLEKTVTFTNVNDIWETVYNIKYYILSKL